MSATPYAIELAHAAAHAASQKKASDIIAIDVSQRLALTDVFLVISAGNERQVMAVVDAVEEALHKAGAKRRMREGYSQAHSSARRTASFTPWNDYGRTARKLNCPPACSIVSEHG